MSLQQTNLFGPPEPATSYPDRDRGRGDDLPVACERELLWPSWLVDLLAVEIGAESAAAALERLYGDIPRRTRLTVQECCRRLRCDSNMIYRHIESGELPAVDVSTGTGARPEWRIYRAGLVSFLVRREFGPACSRADISPREAEQIARAVARARVVTTRKD
jgi:excisionase family DNA binding protein